MANSRNNAGTHEDPRPLLTIYVNFIKAKVLDAHHGKAGIKPKHCKHARGKRTMMEHTHWKT